jgi:hypothetical protein
MQSQKWEVKNKSEKQKTKDRNEKWKIEAGSES